MLWKAVNLSFLFLVLLVNFSGIFAVPVENDARYSVEEQDPIEQIPNFNDKDYEAEKQIYELQLAVWPTEEPQVVDNQHAPVFEEQEIAYPIQEENNEEIEENPLPVWQHAHQETTHTTKRPIQHVVTPTWQQTPSTTSTTTKSVSQEIPVWIYPHNSVNHQQTAVVQPVSTVPVWQQPIANAQAPVPDLVQVPVSVSVPAQTSTSHSSTSQKPSPVAIFPDFGEAESIAEPQHNGVTNNHFPVHSFNNVQPTLKPTKRPQPPVEVVEQFHVVKPSGITEYKLVLSNGMTNYKKIYNKLLPNGKIVTVQEGYDSVPIPGDHPNSNNYQTQYYIADEFGHNVYRVEKQTRKPKFPSPLDYKQQGGQF